MKYQTSRLERGYSNRILTVDLGSGAVAAPDLDPAIRDFFIGGRGLGLYLLHRSTTSRTSSSDPENPLIFSPGPLGGVPQFPGTSKCMAVSLSPLTGIPGVSNFGGHFGAYLKYAGFDALQISGKSAREVMLVIDGFRREVSLVEAPAGDHVFDLEREIAGRFVVAGYDRKDIAFLSTGIGAARTAYGCINSHYFDPTKPADGARGLK